MGHKNLLPFDPTLPQLLLLAAPRSGSIRRASGFVQVDLLDRWSVSADAEFPRNWNFGNLPGSDPLVEELPITQDFSGTEQSAKVHEGVIHELRRGKCSETSPPSAGILDIPLGHLCVRSPMVRKISTPDKNASPNGR